MAHEINNPLQGILALLSAAARECNPDEQCQLRMAQIRSGLQRMASMVQSFAVAYENLPRPADISSVERIAERLVSAFQEYQLQTEIVVEAFPARPVIGMIPELVRLLSDAFAQSEAGSRIIRIEMVEQNDFVMITCRRETPAGAQDGEWEALKGSDSFSGLAVLIDVICGFSGGKSEFRFDHATLIGIRLALRTRME